MNASNRILCTQNRLLNTSAAYPDFAAGAVCNIRRLHETVPGYHPTALVPLPALAAALGVKAIYVKDESTRFGLKAFKGLGGIYALMQADCKYLGLDIHTVTFDELAGEKNRALLSNLEFATATDGNHGKGVAWAAGLLGCRAHVFLPKGSVQARVEAIRNAGKAEVQVTDLCYDDTVRLVRRLAEGNGWVLVQDTSWPGYEEIPMQIIQGYTTMADEALTQLRQTGIAQPTHVFLQAGVGSMAAGVAAFMKENCDACPVITVVEPHGAACCYESAEAADGICRAATGSGQTIMAGLNCGEVCSAAWPMLRDLGAFFLSCPDWIAAEGMRRLARPLAQDQAIVSGESGASAFGAVLAILSREEYAAMRKQIGMNEDAVLLFFSTEGDTDPENYRKVLEGAYPAP